MSEVAKSPRSGLAGPITAIIIILAIIGGIFAYVSSLDADAQEERIRIQKIKDFFWKRMTNMIIGPEYEYVYLKRLGRRFQEYQEE